uniref:Uncharacterized protein n=1 Tax=Opuntia streptacantha TaxID=393608 RepID=A0A7C9ANI2_OPUST
MIPEILDKLDFLTFISSLYAANSLDEPSILDFSRFAGENSSASSCETDVLFTFLSGSDLEIFIGEDEIDPTGELFTSDPFALTLEEIFDELEVVALSSPSS